MVIHKPYDPNKKKISGIRIIGVIIDSEENKWFTFDIRPKNTDFRDELKELRPRVQKIENGKDKYYFKGQLFRGAIVNLIYLNWESAKGLYKNPDNNLPYEILDSNGRWSIYRKSIKETKETIFNNLEKVAIEEELRK